MELEIPSIISAFVPLLLGVVFTKLKPFIDSEKDFTIRINIKRDTIIEKFSVKHTDIFNRFKSVLSLDSSLRGDGVNEPDLVGEFSSELFRYITIDRKLQNVKFIVKTSYLIIYICMVLGLLGVFITILFGSIHNIVIYAGIVLSVLIMVFVTIILFASRKLDEYEETT